MIGGYLSFSGFQALAAFRQTALAEVLPVTMLAEDERVACPTGALPTVVDAGHAALGGAGPTSCTSSSRAGAVKWPSASTAPWSTPGV
jgi:uncharacterized membrane protein